MTSQTADESQRVGGWGGGELKAGDYSEILTVDRQCNGRVVTPSLTLFRDLSK